MSSHLIKRKILHKYFDFVNDKAVCKLCAHSLKTDRTFNLKTHVIKIHKINEDELRTNRNKRRGSESDTSESKIGKHIIKIDVNKRELFRAYIGLVTEDNVPFYFLDSENFRNIIDPICNALSETSRTSLCLNNSNCKKALQLVADNIRNDIKADLSQRLLSLKIYNANELSQNVFSISVQFIENSEIQSHILGMVELKDMETNTTHNFEQEILNILTKYDIKLNQIVTVTSENGGNMMKITKCFADEFKGPDVDDGNESYLRNIQLFEAASNINFGDIQILRYIACTAQLCVLDVVKDPEIKSFLFTCRNLVKFLNKPASGYLDIFELNNLTLPQLDCPKRWGSTYSMIKSLKNAKAILRSIKHKSFNENLELCVEFWNYVEAYYVAFEPLQITISKFQQAQLHYGNFYAEWLKSKLCTEKILERGANIYVEKFIKTLLCSMENRTENLLNDEVFVACLYLDPRFNHTLSLIKKLEASIYLKKLYDRLKKIIMPNGQIKIESPSLSGSENAQFSQKADEYLNEYLTRNFSPNSNERLSVHVKLENLQLPFIRVDSDVLQFWKNKQHTDPELFALSNICFAIPSNLIPESDFSSLKHIMGDNDMDRQDVLGNILLVKQNEAYLDHAVEQLPLFENYQ